MVIAQDYLSLCSGEFAEIPELFPLPGWLSHTIQHVRYGYGWITIATYCKTSGELSSGEAINKMIRKTLIKSIF